VYAQLRESLSGVAAPEKGGLLRRVLGEGVSRNVVNLGLTSLFTDISSEMVSTILPLYLMFYLRLSPLEYGFVDGLYQGASALVRVFGGYAADRWQRYKEVAGLGYAVSAVCKLGMLAVGPAWTVLAAIVLVDRTGKGIRTAPRDALISLSTDRRSLGLAFGVHRALDTCGAMLGPLIAFAVLSALPNAFDLIFIASFCAALVGLGVLGLFVENHAPRAAASRPRAAASRARPIAWREAFGLLRGPGFRGLVVAGSLLSVATMSDGFVYLVLQRRLTFTASFIPLLYVITALFYLLLAVPAGRLADRFGRARTFIGGYVLLVLVYIALLLPTLGPLELFAALLLFGAYYAATDGVLMALASEVLSPDLRTSGMALLTTATGIARLVASLAFGAIWTWWGAEVAATVFLVALVGALAGAGATLARRGPRVPEHAETIAAG
jgi:MFS family permease